MSTDLSTTKARAIQPFARSAATVCLAALMCSLSLRAQEIPSAYPVPGTELPNVRLVSLGGTISGTAKERLNITNYGAPRVDPQGWIDALPELALVANVTPEDQRQPEDRDQRGPTEQHWMKVAKRLQELATDDSVDGIVVTHGTNTMAETAFFMNLTVDIKKPVVFVGAQRPWTGLSGDGPVNMYNAVRVAAHSEATGKGVLQCMNQSIHAARDVTKTSAYRLHTFQSIDLGMMGVADPDIVKFYMEPTRKHTYLSEFNISELPETLPKVHIVYGYSDAAEFLIDALIENGVEGIVVDGTGAGSLSGYSDAVERAQEAGIVVVATARTRGGRVQETPRRLEANVVPGDNLPPEKARILLQLALTKTKDVSKISEIFVEY
ncbi:asparaginase [Pelagicoccus sp. SDUM812003]|uniref:asparaginase n=1 Tax=Pelagicoccus sp. SDUM812003 TaxID=3041267 RepID=UPI00280C89D4|nr:asparaginase [Pelagicoccus sp. SDUM812003]MDQ8204685.1 asparaginase [Pelagicoccus sp. SDUM812003]